MNDVIAAELIREIQKLNKTLDIIAKDLKLVARGDLVHV